MQHYKLIDNLNFGTQVLSPLHELWYRSQVCNQLLNLHDIIQLSCLSLHILQFLDQTLV